MSFIKFQFNVAIQLCLVIRNVPVILEIDDK